MQRLQIPHGAKRGAQKDQGREGSRKRSTAADLTRINKARHDDSFPEASFFFVAHHLPVGSRDRWVAWAESSGEFATVGGRGGEEFSFSLFFQRPAPINVRNCQRLLRATADGWGESLPTMPPGWVQRLAEDSFNEAARRREECAARTQENDGATAKAVPKPTPCAARALPTPTPCAAQAVPPPEFSAAQAVILHKLPAGFGQCAEEIYQKMLTAKA